MDSLGSFTKISTEEKDNLDQLKNFNMKSGIYLNDKFEEKQPGYEQEVLRDRLKNALKASFRENSNSQSKYDNAYNRGSSFSLVQRQSIKKSIYDKKDDTIESINQKESDIEDKNIN